MGKTLFARGIRVTARGRRNVVDLVAALLVLTAAAAISAGSASGANQAANLDQCANGEISAPQSCPPGWQNGDLNSNNSHYREGDSVPFRATLTNLSLGTHTLVIQYDTLAGGKHAYDYLTSYNRTVTSADPCAGVSPCSPGTSGAIPTDATLAFSNPFSTQLPGAISIWNGAVAGVSYGASDAAGQRSLTITFTASAPTAVLAWGGHVASQIDWGVGNSASAISGSPYHNRILSLDGAGGNQDRSMKASAILPTPAQFETQASASSAKVGQSVTDTALLTGPNGPVSGSVAFFVCGPSLSTPDCTTGGTHFGSPVSVGSGSATSGSFSPTLPGRYCFRAEYTPDVFAPYSPANHTNTTVGGQYGECFDVTQVTVSVVTTIRDAAGNAILSAPIGTVVHDTALVSGNAGTPTGNVTFTLYTGVTDCSGSGTTSAPVALTNGEAASGTTTVPPGGISYKAHYLGGGSYSSADGECEPLQASKLTPSVVTTIHDANENSITTAAVGTKVHDSATVSGANGTPTGSVSFSWYTSKDCTGPASDAGTVQIDAQGVAHPSQTATVPPGGGSFKAHYNGDAAYDAADAACEPLDATKLDTQTVTTIHDANHNAILSAPIGSVVHDSAAVTASLGVPTGSVTFFWHASRNCTGAATVVGVVNLNANGVADPSDPVVVPVGGGSFAAHYNGDDAYKQSDGACEPLSATKLDAQAVTTIHDANENAVTSAPIGSLVHDSATVTGTQAGGTPTGTVDFSWYTSTDCTGQSTAAGTVQLDANGVAHPSDSETVPAGGGSFKAHYNGDATYNAADAACEPLSATKLTPQVVTTIHDAAHNAVTSAPIGSAVHDEATVTGTQAGGMPTGTVSFSWYASNDCSGQATAAGTVQLLNGVAHPSDTKTVPVGGGSFKAHYNGDATYDAADAACEPLDATKLDAHAVTTIHDANDNAVTSAPIGSLVHDSATVTGTQAGGTPTGTVSFRWYTSTDCTGESTATGTVQLLNGVAHPSDAKAVPVGGGSFKAHYNGDATYNDDDADCEPLDATKLEPSVVTTIHDANHNPITSAPIGSVVHDSAAVTGTQAGGTPTGTVSFSWYTSTDCTGRASAAGTVQLDANGVAHPSDNETVPAGGGSFKAHYNGDATYNDADAACEPLDATKLDAQAVTTIHDANDKAITSAPIGSIVHDSATVTGTQAGGIPTGTVSFSWYTTTDCTGQATAAGTVKLDANGVAHPSDTKTVPVGGGSFKAHYNGDATYNDADAACEPLDATKLEPSAVTTIHDANHNAITSAPIGSVVHDSANVSGSQAGGTPTGTVNFSWYTSTDCTAEPKAAGTVQLANGVAHPSDSQTVPVGGGSFKAHYNGDATYKPADAACEPLIATKLKPSVVTTIHDANHNAITSAPIGAVVHDLAKASGSIGTPTGSVSFTFYNGTTCSGASKPAGTVQLDANGVAHPSDTGTVSAGGSSFRAHYGGDAIYQAADADCEPLNASKLVPKVVTTIHDANHNAITSALVGSVVHDSASVSGSQGMPTGTVSFAWYTTTNCTGTAKAAGTAQVDSNGVAHPSDNETVPDGGASFKARYNGDATYEAADAECEPLQARPLTTLEVVKNLLPATDSGRFDLRIDGATKAAGVGNGGSTGKVVVQPGQHTVGEVAAFGTDLGEYGASVSCAAGSTQLAKVEGTSASLDIAEGANAVCTITNARKPINLSITKADAPDPATLGGTITYTLVVRNDGPGTATGVKVSDPLPPELAFQSVSTTQGTCTGGVVISCDLGTLASGATATITVLATATRTGVITNTAVVVGDQPEANTADNQATATTLVEGPFTPPSPCETVTVAPHILKAGKTTRVTVRVRAAAKPVRLVRIRARGAGMNRLSSRTNFQGLVRMLLKPQRPGIVTFTAVGRKTCRNTRVGVVGVVTPPVTG